MTLGERIAFLRKGQGLSQEALGELLGVSRQAVSKWESDSAVPDVENCVAMSRVFAIPLSRLLGIEEDEASAQEELTDCQLKMVEEIVGRYLSALPRQEQPAHPKRTKWLIGAAGVLAVVLGAVFWRLDAVNGSVSNLNNDIDRMQIDLSQVQYSVETQASQMANKVQEALDARVNLLAGQEVTIEKLDFFNEEVTFRVSVTPRIAGDDARVEFTTVTEGVQYTEQGMPDGLTYTADVTVPITDSGYSFYATLTSEGTKETQKIHASGYMKLRAETRLHLDAEKLLNTRPVYEKRKGGYCVAPRGSVTVQFMYTVGTENYYPEEMYAEIAFAHNGKELGACPLDCRYPNQRLEGAVDMIVAHTWNLDVYSNLQMLCYMELEKGDTVTITARAWDELGRAAEEGVTWRYDGENTFYQLDKNGIIGVPAQ